MKRGLECGGKRPWGSALAVYLGFATFLLCVSGQLRGSASSSESWKWHVLYSWDVVICEECGDCPVSAQPMAGVIIIGEVGIQTQVLCFITSQTMSRPRPSLHSQRPAPPLPPAGPRDSYPPQSCSCSRPAKGIVSNTIVIS